MRAKFLSESYQIITNTKKGIEEAKLIWEKIKDLNGLLYIEEITKSNLALSLDWFQNLSITIGREINLDLVCSVVGEIEEELNLEANVEIVSNLDEIYYYLRNEDGHTKLKVRVARPKCRWVTLSDKTTYHDVGEVKSRDVRKTIVCD